uniref:Uncharacterized protein n=1 Tax=Romanomermis culicivorax TaxID=13658 RepID=A0A915KHX6_ROMCU
MIYNGVMNFFVSKVGSLFIRIHIGQVIEYIIANVFIDIMRPDLAILECHSSGKDLFSARHW